MHPAVQCTVHAYTFKTDTKPANGAHTGGGCKTSQFCASRQKISEVCTLCHKVFIQIFFHSGARRTELFSLRIENVYLDKGYYQVFVKKGRKKRWVTKVIKEIALPYWREQIGDLLSGYVFSVGLLPGNNPIRPEQVTRRWKRHVKDKLGITADLYSLKHLNTDEISAELSLMEAAKHNSHSLQMAKKHYAVNETMRELERVRKIKNEL